MHCKDEMIQSVAQLWSSNVSLGGQAFARYLMEWFSELQIEHPGENCTLTHAFVLLQAERQKEGQEPE
jgi:hypothetical protein